MSNWIRFGPPNIRVNIEHHISELIYPERISKYSEIVHSMCSAGDKDKIKSKWSEFRHLIELGLS